MFLDEAMNVDQSYPHTGLVRCNRHITSRYVHHIRQKHDCAQHQDRDSARAAAQRVTLARKGIGGYAFDVIVRLEVHRTPAHLSGHPRPCTSRGPDINFGTSKGPRWNERGSTLESATVPANGASRLRRYSIHRATWDNDSSRLNLSRKRHRL